MASCIALLLLTSILMYGPSIVSGQSDTLVEVDIPENQPGGYVVHRLASSPGGKNYLLYHARDSDSLFENKYFQVSPTGVVTTIKPLHYVIGKRNAYDLTIVLRRSNAVAGGTATTLRVNVKDSNTFLPVFAHEMYKGQVKENSPENTLVQGLQNCFTDDRDSDGIDSYQIISGNERGYFKADKLKIGDHEFLILKTTDRRIVRDRAEPRITLKVEAEHSGFSASTTIEIFILENNDYPPEFESSEYIQVINEDTPVMSSILSVRATDQDAGINGGVYYYLDPSSEYFTVNAMSGLITLVQELDYSKKSKHELTVYAQDRGTPSKKATATVKISLASDVPNHPATQSASNSGLITPVFSSEEYVFSFKEDLPVKAAIGVISTVNSNSLGPDNKLTYSLAGSGSKNFRMDSSNGALYLERALDFETGPNEFSLTVTATKQGSSPRSAQTKLTIQVRNVDENLHAPVFEPAIKEIDVSEDKAVGTSVFRASASDKDAGSDGKLVYSAISGSALGYFSVVEDTGEVKVAKALDRERQVSYDLEIEARDHGITPWSSRLFLIIDITDTNDNYPDFSVPVYEAKVPEGAPKGTFVDVIHAVDKDNTAISYGPDSLGSEFSVEQATGVIRTLKPLDRALGERDYSAIVTANDGATKTSKALVRVKVIASAESIPKFTKAEYQVSVVENQGPHSNLVCVAATGNNGAVQYLLASQAPFSKFQIDAKTGAFRINWLFVVCKFFVLFLFRVSFISCFINTPTYRHARTPHVRAQNQTNRQRKDRALRALVYVLITKILS